MVQLNCLWEGTAVILAEGKVWLEQGRLGRSQQKCKSLISMTKGDRKPIPIVGHGCGVSKPTNIHGIELIPVAKEVHFTDRFRS